MRRFADTIPLIAAPPEGIGRGIATEGATVVFTYASSKAGVGQVVADLVRGNGKAVAIHADVAKDHDVVRLVQEIRQKSGRLGVLVNSAGLYSMAPRDHQSASESNRHFETNVLELLFVTREAARSFPATVASIANINSAIRKFALPGAVIYVATNGAVDPITEASAEELAPEKIRVNSANPGVEETEDTQSAGSADGELEAQALAMTPLGRIRGPDDIGPALALLASGEASWIIGETLVVSCGMGM